MEGFKHLLVAIDFDPASEQALDVALGLASKFGATVTLLHAYPTAVSGYGYEAGFMWPIADIARAAEKELETFVGRAKERYGPVEGRLACGEPWIRILEAAESCEADLIVMGTHGRRGVSRTLLGSVAEKVLRLSSIPVLTVLNKEDRQARVTALAELATRSEDEGGGKKPRPLLRLMPEG